MSRQRRSADIGLAAIAIEGGLLTPEQFAAVAATPADARSAAEYGCPKGTSLRDEITRYFRIAQAQWRDYVRIAAPDAPQTARFVKALLEQAFGFEALEGLVAHRRGERLYRIDLEAKAGRVPIVVAAPIANGDAFTRALPELGDGPGGLPRRSPALLLQEWLNANPDFLWGLVFAGDRLRLMRDNASFTRPAYIEADLGSIFRDEMFADFTALWLLIHASRFGPGAAPAADSALERWREAGQRTGTAARERLRGNVEEALLALGQGFLDTNPALRDRLDDGSLPMTAWFEQLLRTVYRLIFLAVAEDRDLLHDPSAPPAARDLYAEGYGFGALRERSARRSARDRHADAWEGMKIVLRALGRGEPLLGLPALGGLFAPGLTPDLDDAALPNRAFLDAVFRLSWLIRDGSRIRINWRDMATEELGSVYEGLLELVPTREEGGRRFSFAGGAEARGNARKVSGSYYTPDSLVQALLDSALDPLLERAEAEGGAEAILNLKVIDPACGSGHFLLGAARRMSNRIAVLRDPDAPDYQAAMRDVVRRSIHGVDRNPMAVELAMVALWIEAIEPGKPLGFLDANIRCGDALLGVFDLRALEESIPDDAYKALTGDDRATANGLKKLNKAEREAGLLRLAIAPDRVARAFDRLHAMPESTMGEVRAKERAYQAIHGDPDWWPLAKACDAYVAAFLLPKPSLPSPQARPLVPTTRHIREALDRRPPQGELAAAIDTAVAAARVFHWPLEFPDVMIGLGGFDCVIGNPPWERIKLQEQEFFAIRAPEIAGAANAAARGRMIGALAGADIGTPERALWTELQMAKRIAEASTVYFTAPREEDPVKGVAPSPARRYPWTARGDVNTYALFAEHFLNLKREGGRAGVIVPTGIATEATTAPFFAHIVGTQQLDRLFDFENRKRIFPGIDSRIKFSLLTLSSGIREAEFSFFALNVADLDDARRRFTLSPAEIARMNPNSKTAPIFRTRGDSDLMAAIYSRVPVLVDEAAGPGGDPWRFTYMTKMFDMAASSHLFQESSIAGVEREAPVVPLYEAKMIHHFDHRWATFERGSDGPRDVAIMEKCDPTFEVRPRYWIPNELVRERLQSTGWSHNWIMGWRDITNATNERTVIATAYPRFAIGHSIRNMFVAGGSRLAACFIANVSSLTLDACARQKVGGTHLTVEMLQQLPILPPHAYQEADLIFIAPRVLELTYTSHSMAPFARDLGCEGVPFAWDEDRRARLRAELDAWYALAYGLSRDELRYVLDPKEVKGADYPSETFRVLQNNEMRRYGEYRTARLVLAAYDVLVGEGMRPRTEGYR